MHSKIACFLVILFTSFMAFSNPEPIPTEKAFQFSIKNSNTDSLSAHWQIYNGYYLYKDRFHFSIIGPKTANLGKIFLPKGKIKTDLLGTHEVYYSDLTLSIPFINTSTQDLKLKIIYQGCSNDGFCYPPVSKLVTLDSKSETLKITQEDSPVLIHNNDYETKTQSILSHSRFIISLLIFFGLGILLAFTPCVLPMLPILSGIILGQGPNITTKRAFWLSLTYVLSMSVTFAFVGIVIALLGSNLQALFQTPWIIILFSLLFILLALSLFDVYEIKIPDKLQEKILQSSSKQHAGTFIGVIIMGVLATLIVSPCVTPPLVGALAFIAHNGNIYLGGAALFFMSLGMGIPLLIVGTSLGKLLPKAGQWLDNIKHFFGLLLLSIAVILLSRLVPPNIIQLMWGSLGILTAIYLTTMAWPLSTFIRKVGFSLGIIIFIYASTMIINSSLQSSGFFKMKAVNQASSELSFKTIDSLENLKNILNQAKLEKKPVLIYFTADWCTTCQKIKKYVLTNNRVIKALQNTVLVKIDVTKNTPNIKAIENNFDVIAPPVFIFYNTEGEEVKSKRIVGEVDVEELLSSFGGLRR
ncbi:MAG: protein-disulfide reductase DsbD [Gammaproteobacteria bacterium]